MQAPAAHDSRAKSQTTRHAWQAMGRAAGRAGSRTIMAVKAAATHDAKDARRSRALSTRRGWKEEGGEKHETGAHADSDCLARSMSGLRLCTLRCGGRAHVLTHHRRRHTRELQRCTRVDLTHMTASVRSWTPWCGPSPPRGSHITDHTTLMRQDLADVRGRDQRIATSPCQVTKVEA